MVDSNFLIKLVSNKQSTKVFLQSLKRRELFIGFPTPVISEFLVRDENYKRKDFLTKTNLFMQILDFDQKSARVSADIFRDLLDSEFFKDINRTQMQVVKVDIQILGMAVA